MDVHEMNVAAWTIAEEVYLAALERNPQKASMIWGQLNWGEISAIDAMLKLVKIAKADIRAAERKYYGATIVL